MENFQEQFNKAIKEYANDNQFSVSPIPAHEHNGVDSQKISQKNIIANIGYGTFLLENVSETFTIKNVPNLMRLSFRGFAANNKIAPATKRAIVNGEILFGKFYEFSGSGNSISASNAGAPVQFVQSFNYMYVDSNDLTKNRVGTGGTAFVLVKDDTGTTVASLVLNSYSNNTLSITSVVGSNWQIQGALTLT